MKYLLLGLVSVAILASCTTKRVVRPYEELDLNLAAGLAQDLESASQLMNSWEELRPGLLRSLQYLSAKPAQEVAAQHEGFKVTWGQLHVTVKRLLELLPRLDADPGLFAREFAWLSVMPEPLMTGYDTPYIEASPVPRPDYPYPLYAKPGDLLALDLGQFHYRWKGQKLYYHMQDGRPVPYHDRRAIDFQGALDDQGLEIAWAKERADIFFMQIQGSGMLLFPDGSSKYSLFAGKNGHRFVSLGRVLMDRGHMTLGEINRDSIRQFLRDNPDMEQELLAEDPSYVFFRLADEGPFGAMGRLLTPRVSVATDPTRLPLGSVLAFDTVLPPDAKGGDPQHVRGIALAHDKGGAIKGNRLDYYCGSGPAVEYFAGHIKAKATVYLLLSREVMNDK